MEDLLESLIVECAAKLQKSKDKSIEEYADELLENANRKVDFCILNEITLKIAMLNTEIESLKEILTKQCGVSEQVISDSEQVHIEKDDKAYKQFMTEHNEHMRELII